MWGRACRITSSRAGQRLVNSAPIPGIRRYARKWPCYPEGMGRKSRGRSEHFNGAAEGAAEQVLVPLDKDLADWLSQQGDLVREVNGLCRFYMDTSVSHELEFDLDEFEAAQASTRLDGPNP